MERTGDIRIVQEMLGHENLETTARYYLRRIPLNTLRAAMEGRDYTGELPGNVVPLPVRTEHRHGSEQGTA
jgi:hypothetical protein